MTYAAATFNAYLQKFGKEKELISYLAPPLQNELKQLSYLLDLEKQSPSLQTFISEVHYTWFLPILEPFSEHDKILLMQVLSCLQQEKLCRHFHLPHETLKLTPLLHNFILQFHYKKMKEGRTGLSPVAFKDHHILQPLLSLNREELIQVADFLGLHDLSLEIRHIVQTQKLKAIEQFLSKEKTSYLKELLKHHEPVSFPPIGLNKWDGNTEKLKKILHHRGINRLAKALYGLPPSLFWQLSLKFDMGRATLLKKLHTETKNKNIHHHLIDEVLTLTQKLKKL